jgi:hypothetical protein
MITRYRWDKKKERMVEIKDAPSSGIPLEMTFLPKIKDGVKSPLCDEQGRHKIMRNNYEVQEELKRSGYRMVTDDEVRARRANFERMKAEREGR